MGTRAQVCVKEGKDKIYLYMHYDGYELPNVVKRALARGRDRWDDADYLARIIFGEMLAFQAYWEFERIKRDREPNATDIDNYNKRVTRVTVKETTGYGIGLHQHDDIEYLVTVNTDNRTVEVWRYDDSVRTFSSFNEFIDDTTTKWEPLRE